MHAQNCPGMVGTALLGALMALGADSAALPAQDPGGQLSDRLVSEEGGDTPVEGALVRLLDEESRSVVADLTTSDGRFVFDRLAAGTYRVQVRRLGYGEWSSEPIRIEDGAERTRTFRVPVRPVELPELRVEQKGECPTDPEEARRALELYEQARPGLRAIAEFVMSHCLSVAESTEGDSLGVAFTPLPGRQVVDVRGVLWLEPDTRAPRSVDYRYTEPEDFMQDYAMPMLRAYYREKYRENPEVRVQYSRIRVPDHGRLGGTIEFREIREGLRATVSWMQRVPVLVHSGWFGTYIGAEVHPRAASWEHSCRVLALAPAENGGP